jgi:hypothetical protein
MASFRASSHASAAAAPTLSAPVVAADGTDSDSFTWAQHVHTHHAQAAETRGFTAAELYVERRLPERVLATVRRRAPLFCRPSHAND